MCYKVLTLFAFRATTSVTHVITINRYTVLSQETYTMHNNIYNYNKIKTDK